ncbi:MAG: integrin alpha [Bacillota bacterium]
MRHTARLRVRQVLDHCLLPVARTVTLSRSASAGLVDGEPVTVRRAEAEVLEVLPGGTDWVTVKVVIHLVLAIDGSTRSVSILLRETLRLSGLTCPGTDLQVDVRKAEASSLRVEGAGSLLRLEGPVVGGQFGLSLALIGDVDGDGAPDLAVGAPSTPVGGSADTGRIYVYSLRTGDLIWKTDGPDPGGEFGFAVAATGDLDGDGVPDLVVGATQTSPAGVSRAGSAFVLSGADGSIIRRHDGSTVEGLFGWSVAGLGDDWNGDGVPDYAVGAPSADPAGLADAGAVYVFCGATGALITQIDGVAAGEALGFALTAVDDLDGDSTRDLVVGVLNASPPGLSEAGEVRVFNRTGVQVLTAPGTQDGQGFGWSVAPAGDWDGDSIPDLLVGAPSTNLGGLRDAGAVFVISGATGAVLDQWGGTQRDGSAGTAVAGLGDLLGGGDLEIAFSAPHTTVDGIPLAGRVVVVDEAGSIVEQLNGTQAGADWGWSLTGLSLFDPEFAGLALGAPVYDTAAGTDAGLVVVNTVNQRASFALLLCLEFSVERPVCVAVNALGNE